MFYYYKNLFFINPTSSSVIWVVVWRLTTSHDKHVKSTFLIKFRASLKVLFSLWDSKNRLLVNFSFPFRYDRRCGIKYDVVYDSVNEKACTRTYEEKCDGEIQSKILIDNFINNFPDFIISDSDSDKFPDTIFNENFRGQILSFRIKCVSV
jgi:hypothetical protein